MRNLEGIVLSEIKESELEKKSINIKEAYDFEDCALTEKEKLQKLEQNLINTTNSQQINQDSDEFEDCALTEKEKLQKLKQNLINTANSQQITQDSDEFEDYEDCRKL